MSATRNDIGEALMIIIVTIFMLFIIGLGHTTRQCKQLHDRLDKIELLLEKNSYKNTGFEAGELAVTFAR